MVGDHRDVVHNSWRANEVGQDSLDAGMRVKFIPYSEYKYERLEKGGIRIEIRSSRPISPSADTTKNRQGEIFEKGGKFGERSVSALHLGNNRERYSRRLSRHGMGRID